MDLEDLFLENLNTQEKFNALEKLRNRGYKLDFHTTSHPTHEELGSSKEEISRELIKKYGTNNVSAVRVCMCVVKRDSYVQYYYRIYIKKN